MNAANLTLYEGYMYTYSYFGVFRIDYQDRQSRENALILQNYSPKKIDLHVEQHDARAIHLTYIKHDKTIKHLIFLKPFKKKCLPSARENHVGLMQGSE